MHFKHVFSGVSTAALLNLHAVLLSGQAQQQRKNAACSNRVCASLSS
jgi:hypothetical protein